MSSTLQSVVEVTTGIYGRVTTPTPRKRCRRGVDRRQRLYNRRRVLACGTLEELEMRSKKSEAYLKAIKTLDEVRGDEIMRERTHIDIVVPITRYSMGVLANKLLRNLSFVALMSLGVCTMRNRAGKVLTGFMGIVGFHSWFQMFCRTRAERVRTRLVEAGFSPEAATLLADLVVTSGKKLEWRSRMMERLKALIHKGILEIDRPEALVDLLTELFPPLD